MIYIKLLSQVVSLEAPPLVPKAACCTAPEKFDDLGQTRLKAGDRFLRPPSKQPPTHRGCGPAWKHSPGFRRGCGHDPFLSLSQKVRGSSGHPTQVEPVFDVILAWRITYATNAHSHECSPGDAAESLHMSLIVTKFSLRFRTTCPRGLRPGLISLATSDLSSGGGVPTCNK